MNFEVFFVKKRGHSWVGKICHLCLEKCSNNGKRWVNMSVSSTKMNKLGTRGGGGGLFSKIPELMHNVLSDEKEQLRSGITIIFAIYLDFFKFRAFNES